MTYEISSVNHRIIFRTSAKCIKQTSCWSGSHFTHYQGELAKQQKEAFAIKCFDRHCPFQKQDRWLWLIRCAIGIKSAIIKKKYPGYNILQQMDLSGLKMIAANDEQCGSVRTVLILLQLFCGIIKARPTMMPWDRGGCCFWVTVSFYLEMVTLYLNKNTKEKRDFWADPCASPQTIQKWLSLWVLQGSMIWEKYIVFFYSVDCEHFNTGIWTAEQCKNVISTQLFM